ncbi:hypothetical protein FRC12_020074 [Ceratobasidium sp. 428]|nr:hypothetical protein FRC12_020074 [Ceratobasidium sp. 428]
MLTLEAVPPNSHLLLTSTAQHHCQKMAVNVGKVPELIGNIAQHCSSTTRTKLLLCCRRFFPLVALPLWRNIKGAEKILLLIEGVTSQSVGGSRSVNIILPALISKANFERFKLYAPFVRHLEIFKDKETDYVMFNASGLLDYSLSTPLLPNLQSLTISSPMWLLNDQRPLLPLLLIFISPSLTKYHVLYDVKRPSAVVSQPRFTAILSTLQQRCSRLHALSLYCSSDLYKHEDELSLMPLGYAVSAYFNSTNLHTLSTSLSVLEQMSTLQPISHVEQLEILGRGDIQDIDVLSNFQDIEWPKLRHVALYLISGIDTFFCLWQIPSLVAGLTSLRLHIGGYRSHHLEDLTDRVAITLAEKSPKLTCLSFNRSPPPNHKQALDPAPLFGMLYKVQVHTLQMDIGDSLGLAPLQMEKYLTEQTFNAIQSLDAGAYRAQLEEFQFFAQSMPYLNYLRIQISIGTVDNERARTGFNMGSEQPLKLCICYVKLGRVEPTLAWNYASRYLLSQWSNLKLLLDRTVEPAHARWMGIFKGLQIQQNAHTDGCTQ